MLHKSRDTAIANQTSLRVRRSVRSMEARRGFLKPEDNIGEVDHRGNPELEIQFF